MTSLALLLGILLGQPPTPLEQTARGADLVMLHTRNISGYLSTCGCSGKAAVVRPRGTHLDDLCLRPRPWPTRRRSRHSTAVRGRDGGSSSWRP